MHKRPFVAGWLGFVTSLQLISLASTDTRYGRFSDLQGGITLIDPEGKGPRVCGGGGWEGAIRQTAVYIYEVL